MKKSLENLKTKTNSNRNRNTRFVKVKQDRVCASCNKLIAKGTQCLTTNKNGVGRRWYCTECVQYRLSGKVPGVNYDCNTYKSIQNTRIMEANLAFGDEGAAMAYEDAMAIDVEQCINCGKCKYAKMLVNMEEEREQAWMEHCGF